MQDEIDLLDYWRVIVKRKIAVVLIVILITSASVFVSFFLPKTYQAKTTIMPVGGGQKMGGLAAMAVAQTGLGGLLGGVGNNSSVQLMAILKSRTLAERMVDQYGLGKVFYSELWDEKNNNWISDPSKKIPTLGRLASDLLLRISFIDDKKTQLIEIKVEMPDAQLAAEVANGYVKALEVFINENTFTVAKKNRIFVEEQLERNKADLLTSGKELSEFYAVNQISNVLPTVDVAIASGLGVDVLQKKADELGAQIQKTKVVRDVPQQVYLQYLTLRHELLGQMNALLTQQYEVAKIDEAKEDLYFQVIDWARTPESRFKPNRRLIVMTTFALSIFLAMAYIFLKERLEKMQMRKR